MDRCKYFKYLYDSPLKMPQFSRRSLLAFTNQYHHRRRGRRKGMMCHLHHSCAPQLYFNVVYHSCTPQFYTSVVYLSCILPFYDLVRYVYAWSVLVGLGNFDVEWKKKNPNFLSPFLYITLHLDAYLFVYLTAQLFSADERLSQYRKLVRVANKLA